MDMKNTFLIFSLVIVLTACGSSDNQTSAPTAVDLPEDIADTPVGTFACQTNADCAADEWCYATAELAACTKK